VTLNVEAVMHCYNTVCMSLSYNNVSLCAINKRTGQLTT